MTAEEVDTYHIELKPGADPYHRTHGISRAPIYRLKRLLKFAARSCGFRINWGPTTAPVKLTEHEPGADMIRFSDGPAEGQYLMLRRAPLYLRVVFDTIEQKWDALDQIPDAPAAGDVIYVYRREGAAGYAMIDWTERGRRRGGRFASGVYQLAAEQPDDATARDKDKWQAWCWEQFKRSREPERPSHAEAATADRAPAAGVQADGGPLRDTPAHADHA